MITHAEARRAVGVYRDDQAARKHVEGLGEPKMKFEDTFSAETVLMDRYFPSAPVAVGAGTAANDNGRASQDAFMEAIVKVVSGLYRPTQDNLPRHGFCYLASPYSLYKHGFHMAARHASRAAASLMKRGLVVFAPISHGHAVAQDNDLPTTWEFWKGQCQPFIDAASACVVLKLDGWQDSVGVSYEVDCFESAGKPVVYVTMDDLALPCGATVEEEWKMGRAA